jgi:hypothetical protein
MYEHYTESIWIAIGPNQPQQPSGEFDGVRWRVRRTEALGQTVELKVETMYVGEEATRKAVKGLKRCVLWLERFCGKADR